MVIRAYLLALALVPAPLVDAVIQVETGGNPMLVSSSGCVGLMQVQPRYAEVPRWALFVPTVNRLEGTRMLAYWHRRASGDWRRALAGYRCGNAGLRGDCGDTYARHVLALAKGYRRPRWGTTTGSSRRQHHLPPTSDDR